MRDSQKFYNNSDAILVAVDCIVFGFRNNQLELLLSERAVNPFKGTSSLIGSFVRKNESVDTASVRVLKQTTGLAEVQLNQLGCFGDVDRDLGGRVISVAYYSLIGLTSEVAKKTSDSNVFWVPIANLPELVFDHDQMVKSALTKVRQLAEIYPIGLNMLPRRFTIPQLQKLYEAIYMKPLDRRNFRKKILKMGILRKLDIKDYSGSKKGAFLYEFDIVRYEKFEMKNTSN